ncbi:MAG TPA: VCBS repeat-containing protein, partial [Kofleriaceae bacterium]|nr:VCBS repeat-containing protein [Kofleriaceae bacterium]
VTLSKDLAKDLFDLNDFGIADPTDNLAVGDFDGDGHDDVFAATGNTWWFSSGAQSEWRFLNGASETVDQLRFGDFDGDHRTDVVAVHDSNVDVAWAGGSSWETLVTLPTGTSIDDLAVGDFDGDGKSDLFVATGSDWFVAYGGHGWQLYATSTYRVRDLLFGDFDGLGKTDIIGNQGGHWSIVPGGTNTWSPSWNPSQTTDISTDTYRVGNFDGIPGDDVMRRTASNVWEVSSKGAGPFVAFRANGESLVGKPIGRFDADSKSDVGVFQDLHLFIASGGKDPLVNQSIHDLR